MGTYKIEEIENDFNTTTDGVDDNYIFDYLKICAKHILNKIPDNTERDIAISKLLETALYIKFSFTKEASRLANQLFQVDREATEQFCYIKKTYKQQRCKHLKSGEHVPGIMLYECGHPKRKKNGRGYNRLWSSNKKASPNKNIEAPKWCPIDIEMFLKT